MAYIEDTQIKKISDLNGITSLTGTDIIPVQSGTVPYKATMAQVQSFARDGILVAEPLSGNAVQLNAYDGDGTNLNATWNMIQGYKLGNKRVYDFSVTFPTMTANKNVYINIGDRVTTWRCNGYGDIVGSGNWDVITFQAIANAAIWLVTNGTDRTKCTELSGKTLTGHLEVLLLS